MHVNQFAPYDELAKKLLPVHQTAEDGVHDISHLERVWRNAKAIQEAEGGNLELIATSVLLHDCVQVPKNSPLREMASRLTATEARTLLAALNSEIDRIQKVQKRLRVIATLRGSHRRRWKGASCRMRIDSMQSA